MVLINPHIDIRSISDIGLVRKNNEDFYGVSNTINGIVCVVCDGIGGNKGGEIASKIAVDTISSFFENSKQKDIRTSIEESLIIANQNIINRSKEDLQYDKMGTTSCILVLKENKAWYAHIGDSRIYLFSKRKKTLTQITKDHSLTQSLLDEGIIKEEDALNHSSKHLIIKALGIKDNVVPDICKNPIIPSKGDIFLLCTDGLHGEISDKEIESILSKTINIEQKSEILLKAALNSGGHDNITFQLVKIKKELAIVKYLRLITQKAKKSHRNIRANYRSFIVWLL